MRLYGTIQKVDKELREVSGYASTEAVDAHGEVVLKAAIEAALDDYLDFPAVREMHALSAVGKTIQASVDDTGLYITAKIVDDDAWKKVVEEVYRGFSIGGKVLARDPDDRNIITRIALNEISLVDRPSNPEARFDVWKAAAADPADPIAKATAALDKIDAALVKVRQSDGTEIITKALRDRDVEIERLRKRIDELLAEPAPPKTAGPFALMAISKEDDAAGAGFQRRQASEDDIVAALAGMSEEDRSLLLIKAAQRQPRQVTMRTAE